jgi:hypothetical protein
VVAALSITSASIQSGQTPYQSAVDCAAAILVTKAALASSDVALGTAGDQALDQAQIIFANRAKRLNADAAARDISEKKRSAGDQAAEQTQLTMSCIGELSRSSIR